MQESERIFIAENATLLRGSERELNRQLFTIPVSYTHLRAHET